GRVTLLAAVTGGANALMTPAINSLLPDLVEPEQIQEANAWLRLPTNLVRIIAPALGGALVGLLGPSWGLGWDAVSFACAALLRARLAVTGKAAAGGRASAVDDFRLGWREFSRRPWLWSYTLSGTVAVALWLGGYQLLGPVVLNSRHAGAATWGTVQGA